MEVVNYIEIMAYMNDYCITIDLVNKRFKLLLWLTIYVSMILYMGAYMCVY